MQNIYLHHAEEGGFYPFGLESTYFLVRYRVVVVLKNTIRRRPPCYFQNS
jgi:hypothetical protein